MVITVFHASEQEIHNLFLTFFSRYNWSMSHSLSAMKEVKVGLVETVAPTPCT
jgi:hypothetical protein